MSPFQPRRDKLVRTEGLTRAHALGASPHAYGVPVGLLASLTLMSQSPTGSSGRRVYCSAMSAKMEHPQGRAPRSLPYQGSPSLSTGWMPEMVEAEGLAPSQPARAARLQRAAIAALPRFGKWGLERDSHPRPSPYEGAALTAAPSSHGGPPRRSKAERPTSRLGARPRAPRASQMLRVLPVKSRRLHC